MTLIVVGPPGRARCHRCHRRCRFGCARLGFHHVGLAWLVVGGLVLVARRLPGMLRGSEVAPKRLGLVAVLFRAPEFYGAGLVRFSVVRMLVLLCRVLRKRWAAHQLIWFEPGAHLFAALVVLAWPFARHVAETCGGNDVGNIERSSFQLPNWRSPRVSPSAFDHQPAKLQPYALQPATFRT